ncbi:ankyrin repeat protein, partial [Ostertagia ostertagi]
RQLADKITNYASLDEIRSLLVCGAQVDAVDEVGCSALHLCAEHGYYRMIKLLLQYTEAVQQYETPVMEANGKYPSREHIDEPLRLAIKNGHYECARLLLENGASPNAIYFDGPEITHVSPLDTHFIALLLEYGADPNVFDRKGLTPIMKACRLKENGMDAIRILHKYGGDVNAQAHPRQDLRTPLHYALLSGSATLVKFLIELGANVTMPKGYNKPSIIDIAVLKDDPELLKIIIDAGADVNAIHTYIGSALHLAACSVLEHQYEILRLLLEAGADPNIQHRFDDGSQLKSPFVEYFRSRDRGRSTRRSFVAVVRRKSGYAQSYQQHSRSAEKLPGSELNAGTRRGLRRQRHRSPTLPLALKGDILERAKNPASLQQICRLSLRSMVAPFRPDVVSRLPIPTHMKEYVLGRSH